MSPLPKSSQRVLSKMGPLRSNRQGHPWSIGGKGLRWQLPRPAGHFPLYYPSKNYPKLIQLPGFKKPMPMGRTGFFTPAFLDSTGESVWHNLTQGVSISVQHVLINPSQG